EFLDYTFGGGITDRGAADVLHGEAGDDVLYGMTGNDVLFGEGQDDDLIGGTGSDKLYGGSGVDGLLGDDGLILTSRNGLTEPLYGLLAANAQTTLSMSWLSTDAVIYATGGLTKLARLEAFTTGGNDTLYGGLGDDFLHGGAGNDALSGAEAIPGFYNSSAPSSDPVPYDAVNRRFTAFDPTHPLSKVSGHLLNFSAGEDDGNDTLFGDNGHDWLVGGTDSDRMFGGLGDDLLNADDNLETSGGLNTAADAGGSADADIAVGGGGRDALIANAANDRLMDWLFEAGNTYAAPVALSAPTVIRISVPREMWFAYELGLGGGADSTYAEPNGELGLDQGWIETWQQMGENSAQTRGLSNTMGSSRKPAVVVWNGKPVVAWEDDTGGDWEIYLKQWTGDVFNPLATGWTDLGAGSGSGRGLSNNWGLSFQPTLGLYGPDDNLNPIVAWMDLSMGNWEVFVRRWDSGSGAWTPTENVSANTGASVAPFLLRGADGNPIIAWQDMDPTGQDWEVYVKRWNGSAWVEMGAGSASGGGISADTHESWGVKMMLGTDGNPIAVWWDKDPYKPQRDTEIFVKRWDGAAWVEMGTDSAQENGISDNDGDSVNPTIGPDELGRPVVAWADNSSGDYEIYARRWNASTSTWDEMGTNSANDGGITDNTRHSTVPVLLGQVGYAPTLAWQDEGEGRSDTEIYVRQWDPDTQEWLEKTIGSATAVGISDNIGDSRFPAMALMPDGSPVIAWEDYSAGGYEPEIYLRHAVTSARPWGLDLLAASDTGVSNSDNITSLDNNTPDQALSFGTAGTHAASTVRLYSDETRLIGLGTAAGLTATLLTNGAVDLADGAHAITARQAQSRDLLESYHSTAQTVTVAADPASAPPAPNAPDLDAASDTGLSNTDNITNDLTPTFNVSGVAVGNGWRLYRDGVLVSAGYQTGASETLTAQPDGTWAYTVRAVDAAGNESTDSPALLVTIDTIGPAQPAAPDLDDASDTGVSATDNLTNDTTPTLNVSGVLPGDYWRIYRDGSDVSDGYRTGPSETLTAQPSGDNTYSYTVRATDAA
ncbi:MAG: calcium-binding protein, partial [Planctomycetes bacterium]|nr:calcium-binding protein [Planctomycetota bacterium]